MAKKPQPIDQKIRVAALKLASENAWPSVTLADIAGAAKISLSQLYAVYPSRAAIIAAIMDQITETVVAGFDPADMDEAAHDRLLDVMLRRFDAMTPDRDAINSIIRSLPSDPFGSLCMAPSAMRSMGWMLESAGISAAGLMGRLRVKGLVAIYLGALPVWLADDSEDLSKTAAFLDRRLRQAARLGGFVPGLITEKRVSDKADR